MMNSEQESALEALKEASSFVVTTHRNPDGDAIGSSLGLMHALRSQGKTCTIILPNKAPDNLMWMPGAEEMLVWDESDGQRDLIAGADTTVVLDLNALSRMMSLGDAIAELAAPIVNIDHHADPEDFAAVQWIDTEAPAVGSMLAQCLPNDWINSDSARCLYTGLMTDTGSFRFPRTTPEVFRIAANLVESGADPVESFEKTLNVDSFERSQLLGTALKAMTRHHDGQLCVMSVSKADRKATKTDVKDTEGFVHHTLSIIGVKMGILFVEVDNEIKCSFRSKGTTHIRMLANKYNGGGHDHAAGARIPGRGLDDVMKEVIEAAKEFL